MLNTTLRSEHIEWKMDLQRAAILFKILQNTISDDVLLQQYIENFQVALQRELWESPNLSQVFDPDTNELLIGERAFVADNLLTINGV